MPSQFRREIKLAEIEDLVTQATYEVPRRPNSTDDEYKEKIKEFVLQALLERQKRKELTLDIYTELTGDHAA